ncbi:MAG TPA: cobalt transporter [Candidatus Blautia excrementipullorum]|nr:cobalt transporter [Candidatus Blautia excrementipullorum]
MHLIKDENGNPVQHGHEHEHSHSTECQGHSHEHCGSCQDGNCQNETVALLTYMLQHNEHHAQELDQMAENLEKLGLSASAKTIREAVSDFQKGNMRLGLALTLVKEELK